MVLVNFNNPKLYYIFNIQITHLELYIIIIHYEFLTQLFYTFTPLMDTYLLFIFALKYVNYPTFIMFLIY